MAKDFVSPSRSGLILGGVLIALHGLENEAVMKARCFQDPNWNQHPEVLEARRVAAAVQSGQRVCVQHERIIDVLAHAQQTLRVSHEEWDAVVGRLLEVRAEC